MDPVAKSCEECGARVALNLRRLFDELNYQFWDGRVPRCRVRRRDLHGLKGKCVFARREIWIDKTLSEPEEVRRVLLHEMCHARIGGRRHGERFSAELQHLFEMGELWASSHQTLYDDPTNVIKGGGIREFMREWVFGSSDHVSWEKARVRVARNFGLSVRELYARYPSARRDWYLFQRKTVRDAERDARLWGASKGGSSERIS